MKAGGDGVLTGHEQQGWYSDSTWAEDVEFCLIVDREVIFSLGMDRRDGLLTTHGHEG